MLIQLANQILPLIMVPYLTRVLGTHLYGVVAFGLAIVNVATVVTDYGFNLSATLQISKHRDRIRYVNRIIGAVFLSKAFLLALVLPGVFIYAWASQKYSAYSVFLAFLCIPIIAQTFQPVWFFQGIERMGYIAIFTLASRVAYIALVLFFVKQQTDYFVLALLNGISQAVALGLALFLLFKAGFKPAWPGVRFTVLIARDSTQFFWSRAAFSTYTAGATLFLGLVSTANQVAYYSAADQLYRGAQSVFAPFSQALYPNMVRTRNFKLLFSVIRWSLIVAVIGTIVGIFFGARIIELIFGAAFAPSYPVLLVLLAAVCVSTPSVLLGYPLLGALGRTRTANNSVLIGGGIQLVLLCVCYVMEWHDAIQVAVTVCLVEVVVLTLRIRWGRECYVAWQQQATSAIHRDQANQVGLVSKMSQ